MDAAVFLRDRLAFIRFFYDTAGEGFQRIQVAIDEKSTPFDDPPYSEDGEPPYLAEWLDAKTGVDVLGLSCVALLSDSLKLYLDTLQHRVIRFSFDAAERKALKRGFLAGHLAALGTILDTDWEDCPADLAILEQVVLARNRAAHGDDLTTLRPLHDASTLAKHPTPFFADQDEWAWAGREPEALSALMRPTLDVSREGLHAAIGEVEGLVAWIEARLGHVETWRARQREKIERNALSL